MERESSASYNVRLMRSLVCISLVLRLARVGLVQSGPRKPADDVRIGLARLSYGVGSTTIEGWGTHSRCRGLARLLIVIRSASTFFQLMA